MDFLPVAGGGLCAGAAFLAWAVRGRSAAVFGESVWQGSGARRALALTFDDGPSESTPAMLDILAQYGVKATFFQVGANVERLPEVARAVAAAGHAIGNHSYSHPLFCFRSPDFMEADLRRAQNSIHRHTGVAPVWFRAPYGVRWFGLARAQRRLSLTGVMWTTIGRDWNRDVDAVSRRLAKGARNGAILCLHDGRELRVRPDISVTVEAVRRLVPGLLARGFEFQTVNELLCPKS
ncbi:MAG TPA: polysaccharide deacetylase family protein [Bryobacteraceae bacterium]|jgi:peptidoglycan/xylan/chitin deacetylase (PgdA/CDA1 family)|nr:polysaccharide deacetylase family protein [Bryobacteraceae bacterium]